VTGASIAELAAACPPQRRRRPRADIEAGISFGRAVVPRRAHHPRMESQPRGPLMADSWQMVPVFVSNRNGSPGSNAPLGSPADSPMPGHSPPAGSRDTCLTSPLPPPAGNRFWHSVPARSPGITLRSPGIRRDGGSIRSRAAPRSWSAVENHWLTRHEGTRPRTLDLDGKDPAAASPACSSCPNTTTGCGSMKLVSTAAPLTVRGRPVRRERRP
jgi:hypothetical protein